MPRGDKCFFPGCEAITRRHWQRACEKHQTVLHRWNTHRSKYKQNGVKPLEFKEYYEKYVKNRKRRITITASEAALDGPDVVYDGGPVSPCSKCKHLEREKHHRGCVECLERVAFAEAVAGPPARAGWGEMVAYGR